MANNILALILAWFGGFFAGLALSLYLTAKYIKKKINAFSMALSNPLGNQKIFDEMIRREKDVKVVDAEEETETKDLNN